MPTDPLHWYQQQLEDLENSIQSGRELLQEYSESLLAATNPGARAELRLQRARLQQTIASFQEEYNSLTAKIETLRQNSSGTSAQVDAKLTEIGGQIQQLSAQVERVLNNEETIQVTLDDQRAEILKEIRTSQRAIVTTLIQHHNQVQLEMTKTLLDAVRTSQIPTQECQELLAAVQALLAVIQQRGETLPHLTAGETERVTNIITEPHLDMSHKLELTIPLIPFLISYQTEIGWSGELHLKTLWERLRARAQPST